MNIFVTYLDAHKSARVLDNKRVIKMCLESAQLLSTAMHVMGATNAPYRPTYVNHPCAIWTRTNAANYLWLLNHFRALCDEYNFRYGKTHKCKQYLEIFYAGYAFMPESNEITMFPNCTKFKKELNIFKAYRLCLKDKWENDKRKPQWTNRQRPGWAK